MKQTMLQKWNQLKLMNIEKFIDNIFARIDIIIINNDEYTK